MRVRAAYTEKRRQMRFTRRKIPAGLNLKAQLCWIPATITVTRVRTPVWLR